MKFVIVGSKGTVIDLLNETYSEEEVITDDYSLPGLNSLADGFASVEKNSIRVSHIFMNVKDYEYLKKNNREDINVETSDKVLKTGQMADLWAAKIIVSEELLKGEVYFCGSHEEYSAVSIVNTIYYSFLSISYGEALDGLFVQKVKLK